MHEESDYGRKIFGFARRIYHRVRKRYRRIRDKGWFFWFKVLNRFSRRSATGSAPVVVSLTSYGSRVDVCGYAIESVARGSIRPQRIILWLDDAELLAHLPKPLERLVQRGLEIRVTKNYGPHTKYYPAVAESVATDLSLVTMDDDIMYPRTWLAGLMAAHDETPDDVVCYRAWVVRVSEGAISPYNEWGHCRSTAPSFRNFATGVSGVLYPPELQSRLAAEGDRFMDITPRADDIWLHWVALRSGFAIRQIHDTPIQFPVVPGTQDVGLVWENVIAAGNDKPISLLYDESDIELLSPKK